MNRILTGIVLILIGLTVITIGKWPLLVWLWLVSIMITHEVLLMFNVASYLKRGMIALMTTGFYLAIKVIFPILMTPISFAVIICLFILFCIEIFRRKIFAKHPFLIMLRAFLIGPVALSYIYILREFPQGLTLTWFCFLSIWSTDIIALYAGRSFGKTPLSVISPNKTIEGTISGIFGTLIILLVYCYFTQLSFMIYLPIGFILSCLAQLGDLHESLVKRHCHVKDSGSVLPGHGGFYDRSDSSIFVFPLVLILFYFIGIL